MAKKLSDLTPAGALADTDLLLVSVGGGTPVSRRATLAQVRGSPRVTLMEETTTLGDYHTIKFAGSALTVTEESPGVAVVTLAEAAGGAASHLSSVTIPGKPGAQGVSTTLHRFIAPLSMTIPANFTGSKAFAEIAPTVSTTLYINKNGVSIGSILFAAGAQIGVFTASPANTVVNLVAGDWVKLYTTTTQDATLADIGITLLLYK
jgi:hypothetical protein